MEGSRKRKERKGYKKRGNREGEEWQTVITSPEEVTEGQTERELERRQEICLPWWEGSAWSLFLKGTGYPS